MSDTASIIDKITNSTTRKTLEENLARTISDLEKIGENPLSEKQKQQLNEVIEAYALTRELIISKVQFKQAIQQELQSKPR